MADTQAHRIRGRRCFCAPLHPGPDARTSAHLQGLLYPTCHQSYWTGLTSVAWPNFGWMDRSLPAPDGSPRVYTHWGVFQPGAIGEPNNMMGSELCGIANASQSYNSAWGWADVQCSEPHIAICKIARRRPLPAPHRGGALC